MPDYNVSTYTQTPPAAGENLYGWTDETTIETLYAWNVTSPSSITLYAWGQTTNGSTFSNSSRVYTMTANPTTSDSLYNETGETLSYTILYSQGSYVAYPDLIGINNIPTPDPSGGTN